MSEKTSGPPDQSTPSDRLSSGSWRARPVFISSTFKDMHAERDWLRGRVFPRLEEELRRRRCHLELIDLRLGVETAQAGTEEARELLILKVCLDEIKRSRPFFLAVLGDRYGWVPAEDRIASAAREQGFETSPTGKSVTALEIEFGILREDPTQKRRSLFFFRRPLPLVRMTEAQRALYSDAHSPDPRVRAAYNKLVALKDRLRKDPELKSSVFDYELGWDEATGEVTGLDDFGELVYEKLWAALDEETRAFAALPLPTLEEQERTALAEFVELRSRIFVGRDDVIGRVLRIARSPEGETTWSACIVGSPGSGKSAVFAKLYRELESDPAILLLANAAGGTQRGSIVESMLRRWIAELAAAAGVTPSLPEKASPDDIETAFYSLLGRVSTKRRVVVLVDALDQFEPTPRGRHLTWLKTDRWPANARLVATGLPCPAVEVLSSLKGIEMVDLPPLSAQNAAEVGRLVWRRYHRDLNPAVLRVILDKSLPDGTSACGNPLWLTLALEQLNLLDTDDFARAEREFTGTPMEKMTALLLDTARRMPPDTNGLYGWLLEQNEKTFGAAHARGFAMALALSRFGWRESDLLTLVPPLGRILVPEAHQDALDDLGLAAMRRGFRAHIVRRGENGQLDFFHAQMRRAMIERCAPRLETRRSLHAAINDHLESMPLGDPLLRLEQMGQLIGERNTLRAARYYAALDEASERRTERVGATWTLVEWIAAGESGDEENANLSWITSWLDASGLTREEVYLLSNKFQFTLSEWMENDTRLSTKLKLIEAVKSALRRLVEADPTNAVWQHDFSVSQDKIGDVLRDKGDLAGALEAYQESLAVRLRLAVADSSNAGWQFDLGISYERIGSVLQSQGNLAGALAAFRKRHAAISRLTAAAPSNAAWQRDLSVSHIKIGDVLLAQGDLAGALKACRECQAVLQRLAAATHSHESWQRDLAVSQEKIGDVLLAQGDLAGAFEAYRESLAVRERLAAADPTNAVWQHDLSVSQEKIGDVLLDQGDVAGALQAYRESLAVRERLAVADPTNAVWQRDLAVSHGKMGDALRAQGDLVRALKACRQSLAVRERLAATDLTNAGWQHDLSVSQDRIGEVLRAQGDLAGALRAYRESLAVRELLAATDPANVGWQHDLSVSQDRIGEVLRAQGDLAGALRAYRESLAVRERLAAMDSSNAVWQRNLSVSLERIGDVLRAQGDLVGAFKAYRESLAMFERLATANPSNAVWQRDLFVSYWRMADMVEKSGSGDALELWRRAYNQLSGMKQRGIMRPSDEKYLRILREKAGL